MNRVQRGLELSLSELHRVIHPITDEARFNRLFRQCQAYIKSLMRKLDPRLIGVDKDLQYSIYTDKFMKVYSHYTHLEPDITDEKLIKFIFKSLGKMSIKMARLSKMKRYQVYGNSRNIDDMFAPPSEKQENDEPDENCFNWELPEEYKSYIDNILDILEEKLDNDEYLLISILVEPPLWFKVNYPNAQRVTGEMLLQFFGIKETTANLADINRFRKITIQRIKRIARKHLKNNK